MAYTFESVEGGTRVDQVDEDTPAPAGERARVVVTDLYNFALPMIRYDIGDVAVVADHDGREAIALTSIEGRLVDVGYDTHGGLVFASTISFMMATRFVDLEQYQLEQDDATSYIFRVASGRAGHTDVELTEALREILGADASIEVDHVDEIPSEANGKYRSLICHYQPQSG